MRLADLADEAMDLLRGIARDVKETRRLTEAEALNRRDDRELARHLEDLDLARRR